MYGGLTCGVGAADDIHIFVLARRSFSVLSAVVDTCTGETVHAGDVQATPLHARCDHHTVADQFLSGGEFHHAVLALHAKGVCLNGSKNFRAEAFDLRYAATCQVCSAETRRETKVIFDTRTEPGLAAGSLAFNQNGVKPFSAAIECASESCRTGADDDHIIEVANWRSGETELSG